MGPDPLEPWRWSATRENRVGGGYDEGLADSLHPPGTLQGDRDPDIPGAGEDPVGAHRETDAGFRVRLDALESVIDSDKQRGFRPAVLVTNAGSTATGSIDPLPELASIARREGMWLHADAAYGGGVLLHRI